MNSEELYQIVKKNLQNLIIVDDVLEIPEIYSKSFENYDSELNENELYTSLRHVKKKAQLKLNLHNLASQYETCQILNEDSYPSMSSNIFNYEESMNENGEDSVLIKTICCYIKSYKLVLHAELKVIEKNENFISRPQNIKRDSLMYINEIPENNEYSKQYCNKCSFINRKSLANCEICFSSLTNPFPYEKPKYDIGIKTLSLPTVKNTSEQFQYIIYSKKRIIHKNLFRILFRYQFSKTDKWKCNKCGLENSTHICRACLNSSPDINKWQCEKCQCVNKIISENCKYCQFLNPNLIVCSGCKNLKVMSERIKCDNCWLKEFSHFKTNKAIK